MEGDCNCQHYKGSTAHRIGDPFEMNKRCNLSGFNTEGIVVNS